MASWAWLGDMELDDTLLGLGAAGIFSACEPLALGFLVNAAHCTKQGGDGGLRANEMYRDKRAFLEAFFGDRFYAVLDRYAGAGKGRGWAGELTEKQLDGLGDACGLQDELEGWLEAVERGRPRALHLLVSGPLLGRGEELCSALAARVLAPRRHESGLESAPRLFIWTYAGSFNLSHSSEQDRASLKKLVEDHSPRVSVVETTLKAGAWVCDPPRQFWASACPTAWTQDEARRNPVAFDISTDIQNVNTFLEEYSSPPSAAGAPRRGLHWIFQQIAAGQGAPDQASEQGPIPALLRDLELHSLATNLTKMVPPDSSSMGKLREALPVRQEELEAAFSTAVSCLKELESGAEKAGSCSLEKFTKAAQDYAKLYRGPDGIFLEAGSVECFPSGKPFSGPRMDKRSILRCMAEGQLQGGPTADLLVVLALLLFLPELGSVAKQTEEVSDASVGACCSLACTPSPLGAEQTGGKSVPSQLPPRTRELFQLQPGGATHPGIFSAMLRPDVEMDESCRIALAPLVDSAIEAIVAGGIKLQKASVAASWGLQHAPLRAAGEAS